MPACKSVVAAKEKQDSKEPASVIGKLTLVNIEKNHFALNLFTYELHFVITSTSAKISQQVPILLSFVMTLLHD